MTDAEYVKDARARLRMTQHQLALVLGVTERSVSLWETGKVPLLKARRRHIELLLRDQRKG